MLPLSLTVLVLGYLLVYAGVRNVSPVDQVRGAITG